MARNLPRGSSRTLEMVGLHHHPKAPSKFFLVASYSQFNMGQNPQEGVTDQVRKEVIEEKPSKSVSADILPRILNLYASRATPKDFEIYAPNATFEDPLMRAHGVKQIKSAFYSLSKIFSESRIVDYTITEKETSPGKTEILIDNNQYYKFLGRDINMISLIKLDTEDGKVVAHQDRV
ncbi:uncharacterized protein LOC125219334 isoform X2 [Salvia hispanica]|uniref:uncharacterized protein LOC125219334 isoform X2 n=1 Tax=Salvia hispanica TaxID=49212 RepID=UPI0020092E79|nr:uncharacterized protein LOC125219334 isoform X2 [Salvia hispanica]